MTQDQRAAAVWNAIVAIGPRHGYVSLPPLLVYAQAVHESDYFRSNLAVNALNVFGMKQPSVRPTTSVGPYDGGPYASYASFADAVEDYFMRMENFHVPDTADPAQYMADVQDSGYFEDPAYLDKWSALYLSVDAPGADPYGDGLASGADDGPGGAGGSGGGGGSREASLSPLLLLLALGAAVLLSKHNGR